MRVCIFEVALGARSPCGKDGYHPRRRVIDNFTDMERLEDSRTAWRCSDSAGKGHAMKKSLWGYLAVACTALTLVLAMVTPAYAVKRATLKNASYTTIRARATKNATMVTSGTYRITIASGKGYAKFTAPATKTYTFVVSDVKNGGYSLGYWYIVTSHGNKSRKYIGQGKVPTNGGKSTVLRMALNGRRDRTGSSVAERYLASRYGKIRLKRGETIFLYFNFFGEKTRATLKVK